MFFSTIVKEIWMMTFSDTDAVVADISKQLLNEDQCDQAYLSVVTHLSSYFGCWCGYVLFFPGAFSIGDLGVITPDGGFFRSCLLRESSIEYYIQKEEWPFIFSPSAAAHFIFDRVGLSGASTLCPIVVNGGLHGALVLPVIPENLSWLYVVRSQLEAVLDRIMTIAVTRDLYRQLVQLHHSLESMVNGQLQHFRQEMEMAKRCHHEKILFLSQMSHDLRTPLHVIVGMYSLLQEKNNAHHEILSILSRGCDHLDRVIHNIFSSIRS